MKIRILAAILKRFGFFFFFCIIVVVDVYRYGERFVRKFLREITSFRLGPSGPLPPCAQTGVKSSLRTKVLIFLM